MKPVSTGPVSSSSPTSSGLRVPTLEQLLKWTSRHEGRIALRGVDWEFYERLVDSIPDGAHLRVNYDGQDVEIMSPGMLHDGDKKLLGQLVECVAQELEIPYRSAGSTTWRRPDACRGLEADECYFFKAEKLAAVARSKSRRSKDIADYPNPDLAIEVDFAASKIDRPTIYSALGIEEVWRFDGETARVIIERLREDGSYRPVDGSGILPLLAPEVRRWVVEEDASDESAWARRLRARVRAELTPRRARQPSE